MSKQGIEEKAGGGIESTSLLDWLIEQQCVAPVGDIDEISRLWPGDDDPDLLLEFVLGERRDRLKLDDEDHG